MKRNILYFALLLFGLAACNNSHKDNEPNYVDANAEDIPFRQAVHNDDEEEEEELSTPSDTTSEEVKEDTKEVKPEKEMKPAPTRKETPKKVSPKKPTQQPTPAKRQPQPEPKLKVYKNTRFDYYLTYPGFLKVLGEADNSDGNFFRSADGKVDMRVYGEFNILDETAAQYFKVDKKQLKKEGCKITYTSQKGNWNVISGYTKKGRIFYKKVVFSYGHKSATFDGMNCIFTVYMECDKSAKAKGDEVIRTFQNFPKR